MFNILCAIYIFLVWCYVMDFFVHCSNTIYTNTITCTNACSICRRCTCACTCTIILQQFIKFTPNIVDSFKTWAKDVKSWGCHRQLPNSVHRPFVFMQSLLREARSSNVPGMTEMSTKTWDLYKAFIPGVCNVHSHERYNVSC